MFEATVGGPIVKGSVKGNVGLVSQSGQWAPFDVGYNWKNGSSDAKVYDDTVSKLNDYKVSALCALPHSLADK